MRVVLPSNHLTAQIPSANLKKLGPAENLDSGIESTSHGPQSDLI
jgi:hypothetical protein